MQKLMCKYCLGEPETRLYSLYTEYIIQDDSGVITCSICQQTFQAGLPNQLIYYLHATMALQVTYSVVVGMGSNLGPTPSHNLRR